MKKGLTIATVVLLFLSLFVASLLLKHEVLYSLDELPEGKNTVVTLGFQLSPSGQMQPELIQRLERTLELAHKFPEVSIIVSGGAAKTGATEAELMKNWLMGNGVRAERITTETKSIDTVENALFTTELLAPKKPDNVILISSAYHLPRAALLFELAFNKKDMEETSIQALASAQGPKVQLGSLWATVRDALKILWADD